MIDATQEKNGTFKPQPQINNIDSAQSVSIVDYTSTIAKVNAENEAMKEQMETMKKQMDLITAAMAAKNQA